MARLPIINRYVAASLAGKSTALITNLRQAGDSPQLTGTEPSQGRIS
ncbi:hypothetical protein [Micromonospora deserti]|nr:hypothetical protein [Micromonospora deserti]